MAIDNGLQVTCSDLQAVGGIRQIIVADIDEINTVTTAANHSYSALTSTSGACARFEFKNEAASLAINATKENGSTSFECVLSWYIPSLQGSAFEQLKDLQDACIVAVVELNSGTKLAIGISETYASQGVNATPWDRNQTYANLSGFEGNTGSAYSDENGITVTLTARQFELPREYTGAITVAAGDTTATLA